MGRPCEQCILKLQYNKNPWLLLVEPILHEYTKPHASASPSALVMAVVHVFVFQITKTKCFSKFSYRYFRRDGIKCWVPFNIHYFVLLFIGSTDVIDVEYIFSSKSVVMSLHIASIINVKYVLLELHASSFSLHPTSIPNTTSI